MRRLTAVELNSYDHVAVSVARAVRIRVFALLPPGYSGMTLGRLILLRRDDDRSGGCKLLAHELVHVQQFAQIGVTRFLSSYLREYLSNLVRLKSHAQAYRAISFEVEAREIADRWDRLNATR